FSRSSTPSFLSFPYTPTPQAYTLSLHDALPISIPVPGQGSRGKHGATSPGSPTATRGILYSSASCENSSSLRPNLRHRIPTQPRDRKSTRLNSSHVAISYAVFCLKKKIIGI